MVRLVDPERRQARNYLARSQQWRLLALILPMGLVLLLMMRLRDPKVADAINTIFSDDIKSRPVVAETAEINHGRSLIAQGYVPLAAQIANIPADVLGTIQDNTYFRNAEKEAWFQFFGAIQKVSPDGKLKLPPVDYAQLMDQPDAYRARLVTMPGRVRQVTKQKPAANDLGIESYYRVILQPSDDLRRPVFVYCLELPPGLEKGENLSVAAEVTGLFFKKLSYQSDEGLSTAPVIVAKTIGILPAGEETVAPPAGPAPVVELPKDTATAPAEPKRVEFAVVMKLAGWDSERFAKFDDGTPLSDEQRAEALQLLRRLRMFDSGSLENWAASATANGAVTESGEVRGKLIPLRGRVTKVTRHTLPPADAERLELPEYFECELQRDRTDEVVTILTTRVPKQWLSGQPLEERAEAIGLFLKRLSEDRSTTSLWLAKDIAWFPGASELAGGSADRSQGRNILGSLGMDVGLFDQVRMRGKIRAEEQDAFYRLLAAVNNVGAASLIASAQGNLPGVLEAWQTRKVDTKDAKDRRLAQEVVRRAEDGRYSVAPLFNDPENQIGRLFVFDGTARRAVRVAVEPAAMRERFGFDHYYELEVFTDDSQNFPLVFVVRELPAGFPTGGSIHVPVRMAGFFFKDWLYRTRKPAGETADGKKVAAEQPQYAPLLVGRSPVVLAVGRSGSRVVQYVAAGLFVLAVTGVIAAVALFSRGDRRFRESTLARSFALAPGESLNELNVPASVEPMKK